MGLWELDSPKLRSRSFFALLPHGRLHRVHIRFKTTQLLRRQRPAHDAQDVHREKRVELVLVQTLPLHEALDLQHIAGALIGDLGGARHRCSEVKARLMNNTQQAHDRGAFGSPTFFVGEEIFFGKDRLNAVEQEILKQRSSS